MTDNYTKEMLYRQAAGEEMFHLIKELYPICRSITGDGLRKSLNILKKYIPLEIHEVPSGTQVFDWIIPEEWNIKDAYVKNSKGIKVIDFKKSNLHILNYSIPVNRKMPLTELKDHLFTLPEHPDWIPSRHTYYKRSWGFCLSHNDYLKLGEGEYEVLIDTTLHSGHLSYGECFLPGLEKEEVLISCHSCHPSLCNDNLSGMSLGTFLAKYLSSMDLRYSYRFLFSPGTIGPITWLANNQESIGRIKHGLVLSAIGDPEKITYKRTRQGDAEIDRAMSHILKHSGDDYRIIEFDPGGYDERQFCSPGFNLPVGRLSRSLEYEYPEYHTSADNLDFIKPLSIGDTFVKTINLIHLLENNRTYKNLHPHCEPQLGSRGLYSNCDIKRLSTMWVLNMSDGQHSLLDIAERSNTSYHLIKKAADILYNFSMLVECDSTTTPELINGKPHTVTSTSTGSK